MNFAAQEIVAVLRLSPLPHEGGFFRQTWRSAAGSAIYFLMTPAAFSALHRLRTDETWHFYAGDPVEHVQLDAAGGVARCLRLGPDVTGGDTPQLSVAAGVWQGARPMSGAIVHGWSLCGCTMAPPWDEQGFELGARDALLRAFPAHADIVRVLTR